MKRHLFAFLAGFLATLCFHQPVLWVLHVAGFIPRAPYVMTPVPPFGVPSVISLAFCGGVWGIILVALLAKSRNFVPLAVVFGAIAPTLVAKFVVSPIKHQPIALTPAIVLIGLAVNAAWGLGTAVFFKLFSGKR